MRVSSNALVRDADRRDFTRRLVQYRKNPVAFVRQIFKAEPTDQQQQVLTAIAVPGAKTAVASGHGIGKSTLLSWTIIWFLSCHDEARILCTAPTAPQLNDILWSELRKWHEAMHPWLRAQFVWTSDKYFLGADPHHYAAARTSRKDQPEALQGRHQKNMLFIVDEASGVPENVYEAARGSLSTRRARVLLASNPTRVGGYFYNAFHKNRHRWTVFNFSSKDSPLVDETYWKEILEEYGEDSDFYKVRVLGQFPSQSVTQLIPLTLAEAAAKRVILPRQIAHAPLILGVDVAWEGDDRSSVFFRQGLHSKLLGRWHKIDNMALADLVAQYEDEYNTDATFIDVGWGSGVIDRLRQLGRQPIPVNFGGKSASERAANKRTEMWLSLKAWLQDGGQIPNNPELIEDLIGPQYMFTPSGKIQLEKKKDMKARGLKSPDIGDSLALTFAGAVRPKAEVFTPRQAAMNAKSRGYKAKSSYDVLDMERG